MRLPIALGLAWPDRVPDAAPACDWSEPRAWTFDPLDDEAFPAVRLARHAGTEGGTAPAAFNAANEVAVEAFRAGGLSFPGIVDTIAAVLAARRPDGDEHLTLAAVLDADAAARRSAAEIIARGHGVA
jgi:1-deoxy-D-xylulose-5-phosphate reductoisomerase